MTDGRKARRCADPWWRGWLRRPAWVRPKLFVSCSRRFTVAFRAFHPGQFVSGGIANPTTDTVELLTETEKLNETRLQPGWSWASGAPPRSRDTLRGIFFQVVSDGVVVQTFSDPSVLQEEIERERPSFFYPPKR